MTQVVTVPEIEMMSCAEAVLLMSDQSNKLQTNVESSAAASGYAETAQVIQSLTPSSTFRIDADDRNDRTRHRYAVSRDASRC